jgi:hypothetical protein
MTYGDTGTIPLSFGKARFFTLGLARPASAGYKGRLRNKAKAGHEGSQIRYRLGV